MAPFHGPVESVGVSDDKVGKNRIREREREKVIFLYVFFSKNYLMLITRCYQLGVHFLLLVKREESVTPQRISVLWEMDII